MADSESELKRMTMLLEQANRELAQFGKVTQSTKEDILDAQVQAKTGIRNFTKGVDKAGEALGVLTGAYVSQVKTVLEGKRGAAAFNESLDKMAQAATLAGAALSLLLPGGPLTKGLILALTALTTATVGAVNAANEMADKIYKGFSDLAKVGGSAAGGMTAVRNNAQKLGYSMNELDKMVGLVTDNAETLAMFGGSVSRGVDYLSDMGKALTSSREEFFRLGLGMEDVNAGMAGMLRLQAQTGNLNKLSAQEQAKAAKEYIYEMNILTRLTGMSAREQEQKRQEALSEEIFLSEITRLRSMGAAGQEAANRLETLNLYYAKFAPNVAKQIRASVANNLADENSQKAMIGFAGKVQDVTFGLKNLSLTEEQAANILNKQAKIMSDPQTGLVGTMAQFGKAGEVAGQNIYQEQVKMAGKAGQDQVKIFADARKELEDAKKKGDKDTAQQAEIRRKQMEGTARAENALAEMIPTAQRVTLAMINSAEGTTTVFEKLTKAINALLQFFGFREPTAAEKDVEKTRAEEAKANIPGFFDRAFGAEVTPAQKELIKKREDAEAYLRQERRRLGGGGEQDMLDLSPFIAGAAEGGVLSGPQSGYLAMLHGTEAVIPLKGTGMSANLLSGKRDETAAQKIGSYITEISKDLEVQVKIVDKDTKAIKDFSDFQKRYHDKLKDVMENVMEALPQTGGASGTVTGGAGSGATSQTFLSRLVGSIPGLGGGATATTPEQTTPAGSVSKLMNLIGAKESGNDYNILVGGKRADLVNMTVREVMELQQGMRARGHETDAVGKYQFMGNTLRGIVGKAGVSLDDKFDQATQEKLGMYLLQRRGLSQYLSKKMDADTFADNLAMEWAALPTRTGKSHYHGVGSNKAGVSRQEVIASLPAGQTGGVFSGPTSGYPVMLHGNEVVIPMPNSTNLASMIGSITKTSLNDAFGKSSLETQTSMNQLITMHSDLMGMLASKLDSLEKRISDGNSIQQQILYSAS